MSVALQGAAMTGLVQGLAVAYTQAITAGTVGGVAQNRHDPFAGDFRLAYYDGGGVGDCAGMVAVALVP